VPGLKLHSPEAHETCARLVAENPLTAEKRKNLLAHQNELLLAREELFNALGWEIARCSTVFSSVLAYVPFPFVLENKRNMYVVKL
jgi:hypothetical protein